MRSAPSLASPRSGPGAPVLSSTGLTLVEVTLALGIVAFALVAVLGLIPVAMQASRDAADDTAMSLIAQDVAARLKTIPHGTTPETTTTATWFYDRDGQYLPDASKEKTRVFYRANAQRGRLALYPTNTDPDNRAPSNDHSQRLLAVTVTITRPVDPNTLKVPLHASSRTFSYLLRVIP